MAVTTRSSSRSLFGLVTNAGGKAGTRRRVAGEDHVRADQQVIGAGGRDRTTARAGARAHRCHRHIQRVDRISPLYSTMRTASGTLPLKFTETTLAPAAAEGMFFA